MKLRSVALVLVGVELWMGAIGSGQSPAKAAPAKSSSQNPLDSFKNFAATLNGGMGRDHDRKIYRSGNLLRLDFDRGSYRIVDLEKGITWGVDANTCSQFMALDAGSFPFSAFRDFKFERVPTAEEETIDGHVCTVETFQLTSTDEHPRTVKMKLWGAKDLNHFPIKIEVEPQGPGANPKAKLEVHYSNVSLSAPDPSLFKHPVKCTPGGAPAPMGSTPAPPSPTTPKAPAGGTTKPNQ